MSALVRNERGSALIIAVMAMLVMGVLSISFALLADIESRVGVSYKQQAQAEALAEAALERARDAVRSAPTTPQGFTTWFGAPTNHVLYSAVPLDSGQYWARIDNDCAAVNTVPSAIEEPPHPPGATACDNVTDFNQVAVITAWAVSGQGRSRTRAVIGVDNPWRHVCSNARPDNNGYCNEPGNRNGNPTVSPADPGDPNGPQAYNDLPRPILGCSRIAPRLHRGPHSGGSQRDGCIANNGMYPFPYPVAPGTAPRFVMMGELPGAPGGTPKSCNDEPAGGSGNRYFGYFDCALTTYCRAADGDICPSGVDRKGCLPETDSRVIDLHPNQTTYNPKVGGVFTRWVPYDSIVNNRCGNGGANETGMVFNANNGAGTYTANTTVNVLSNVGSQGTRRFDIYVFDATLSIANNLKVYGTLVVEGNEVNLPCSDKDFRIGGGASSEVWAGPNSGPAVPVGWSNQFQYGYPLAVLVYNPDLPPPTVTPTYAPQGTCADLGSSNSEIHGMVYSGGHVEFNPLTFDGTVVAFEIQTQGSATYNYNPWYGLNTPPPGFPFGAGNQVVIIRKSFVVCTNYNDEPGGPSPCS